MGLRLTIRAGAEPGKSVELEGGEFTIGRDDTCDLTLKDVRVSRKHAFLEVLPDGRTMLRDLKSQNGTFVNGRRVRSAVLRGGENLRFGDTIVLSSADGRGNGRESEAEEAVGAPDRSVAPTRAGAAPPPPDAPPPAQHPPQAPPPARPASLVPDKPPTPSTIQRLRLQRSVNNAIVIGIVAIVAIVGLGIAFATGLLGNGGSSSAANPAQVVARVAPSTVLVVADTGGGRANRGSGWVWDAKRGLIVTNAHVAEDGRFFTVGQGRTMSIELDPRGRLSAGAHARLARLRGSAPCEDIAVLQAAQTGGLKTLARFPSQSKLNIGESVVAVGYPSTESLLANPSLGANLTGNTGVVSQPQTTFPSVDGRFGPYRNVILTDTAINEGNSGGPLVDLHSRLVGMNTAGRTSAQGQNYAIGIDRLRQIVPELLAGRRVCG